VCVLLCMLDVLDVPEVTLCVATLLDGGDGLAGGNALCATLPLEMLDVLDVPEVMLCVLVCMLEVVEVGLGFGVSKFSCGPYSPPPRLASWMPYSM